MSLRNYFAEKFFLPISDRLTGQSVSRNLKLLMRSKDWSREQLLQYQIDRLRMLVDYISTNVPFYRDYFKEHHLSVSDFQVLSDLSKLPILNKQLIRAESQDRFVSEDYPVGKRLLSRSSGSTGEPFSFFVSKEAYSMNTAAKLRTWYQAGYRLGNKYMKIANGPRHGKLKTLQDRMNHCIYVPFFEISDSKLEDILMQIEKEKPTIIRSYPVPLFLLSQYRLFRQSYHYCPAHIMTTGSTLPDEYRETIEKAFGCDVIDSYSCEGTPNTAETPAHDGYHLTSEYAILEVLDEDDNPVVNGVGRVVSTDLWNYAQPFVRYDTQDLVEVIDGKIIRILGRECEAYCISKDVIYTVHNFSKFFLSEVTSVDSYQIVKRKDSIIFKLVPNSSFDKNEKDKIIDYWTDKLDCIVKIEVVDSIPIMRNNKRLTIVEE